MTYTSRWTSPLGQITLAGEGGALTGLWFEGQERYAATLTGPHEAGTLPVLEQAARWLEIYFGGGVPDFTPPLDPAGTDFSRRVWRRLLAIPRGQTVTYGQLAAELGLPAGAARVVGGAVGRNPISILIPCHRVVGANGALTGYAGGLERKRRLLALEGCSLAMEV